MQANFENHLNL